jgi:hypothetical protein
MTSKTLSRSLALAAATVALGAGVHEAHAGNTAVGSAQAAIVQAISVSPATPLNFGFIIPGATAGTLVVSPTGVTTPTGVTYLNGAAAGTFTATGTAGEPLVVTFDASDTLAGPGPAMTINAFTAGGATTFTSGTVTFSVGATLAVGTSGAQTAGNYTGNYNVTVNY